MKLKKYKYVCSALAIAAGVGMSSCADYLSVEGKVGGNNLTLESIFASEDLTNRWMAQAYSQLNGYSADYHGKDWCITAFDDCFGYGDRSLEYKQFRYAEYNEDFRQSQWAEAYFGIRQASTAIHYIHLNQELTEQEIVDFRGQARFIRAYLYWKLLKAARWLRGPRYCSITQAP